MTDEAPGGSSRLPPALHGALDRSGAGRSRWSADEGRALATAAGLDDEALLRALVPLAAARALAPISGFAVGAVARARSGAIYLGCNLEFVGQGLGLTVHAEQAAVAHAWAHGEEGLDSLALSAVPCGHCRQFLQELDGAPALRLLVERLAPVGLASLLPHPFGPGDLGMAARLMAPARHGLKLSDAEASLDDPLLAAALSAAERSHAPYTRSFAGAAVQMPDGRCYSGAYAENAAFNPSLSPMHGALIHAHLSGAPLGQARQAVLVQVKGAPVDHVPTAHQLLASLAGRGDMPPLRVVHVRL